MVEVPYTLRPRDFVRFCAHLLPERRDVNVTSFPKFTRSKNFCSVGQSPSPLRRPGGPTPETVIFPNRTPVKT